MSLQNLTALEVDEREGEVLREVETLVVEKRAPESAIQLWEKFSFPHCGDPERAYELLTGLIGQLNLCQRISGKPIDDKYESEFSRYHNLQKQRDLSKLEEDPEKTDLREKVNELRNQLELEIEDRINLEEQVKLRGKPVPFADLAKSIQMDKDPAEGIAGVSPMRIETDMGDHSGFLSAFQTKSHNIQPVNLESRIEDSQRVDDLEKENVGFEKRLKKMEMDNKLMSSDLEAKEFQIQSLEYQLRRKEEPAHLSARSGQSPTFRESEHSESHHIDTAHYEAAKLPNQLDSLKAMLVSKFGVEALNGLISAPVNFDSAENNREKLENLQKILTRSGSLLRQLIFNLEIAEDPKAVALAELQEISERANLLIEEKEPKSYRDEEIQKCMSEIFKVARSIQVSKSQSSLSDSNTQIRQGMQEMITEQDQKINDLERELMIIKKNEVPRLRLEGGDGQINETRIKALEDSEKKLANELDEKVKVVDYLNGEMQRREQEYSRELDNSASKQQTFIETLEHSNEKLES